MAAKAWRRYAVYTAVSAFLAWHSFVMLTAPLPEASAVAQALSPILHPYLSLFSLDNRWDFFAPSVRPGYELRYILETADGSSRVVVPMKKISWYNPYFIWTDMWQDAIIDHPETYADLAAGLFCREQGSLRPTAVSLMDVEQREFWPQDFWPARTPSIPTSSPRKS